MGSQGIDGREVWKLTVLLPLLVYRRQSVLAWTPRYLVPPGGDPMSGPLLAA